MTRIGFVGALLVALMPALEAHQLDEYLQATRITITPSRVEIDLRLTPGVSVAAGILQSIDSDGDARISPQEIERYASRVLGDVMLRVDDRTAALALERAEAPLGDELRDGVGTVSIRAFAEAALTPGVHHVHFENAHARAHSVYLVNAIKPATDDIAIDAQRRDRLQHGIDLDVNVGATSNDAGVWLAILVGLLAASIALRSPEGLRRQPLRSPEGLRHQTWRRASALRVVDDAAVE